MWVVIGLSIVFAALSLLNTAAMATAERRGELATIRLLGGTRWQAIRMVALELAPIVVVGLVAGAAVAAVSVMGVPEGVRGIALGVSATLVAGLAAGAALLGLAAGAVTARKAMRVSPAGGDAGEGVRMDRMARSVLVVDDSAPFRATARALLEARGYRVVGAVADGGEALAAVAALRPDAVLLDISLPDTDGIAVAGRLSGDGGPAVVLVSTLDAAALRQRRRALGRPRLPAQGRPHLARAGGAAGAAVRPVRIVIAEDQALLREGMVRLLEDAGFEVVAEAGDAPDLLRKVGAHKPDLAIVDVQMPPGNEDDGLRAALEIRATQAGDRRARALPVRRGALRGRPRRRRRRRGVGYLLKDRVADFARVRRGGPPRRRRRRRARSRPSSRT